MRENPDFRNREKDEDVQSQLDHLNECLVEFYNDMFEEENYDTED